MKQLTLILIAVAAFVASIALAGCGHSGIAYVKGQRINLGLDPQNFTANVSWMDGETVLVGSKENTEVEISLAQDTGIKQSTSTADGQSATQGRVSKIKYTTGQQVNGYFVELAKLNPELAAKLLTIRETKYYLIKNDEVREVSKAEYASTEAEK